MNTEGGYGCVTCGEKLNIVGVAAHDCEEILGVLTLTPGERDTLVHVEERLVNNAGRLDWELLNHEDREALGLFASAGLLDFDTEVASSTGRFPGHGEPMWQVTEFTERAFELAHKCRRMRAGRAVSQDSGDGGPLGGLEVTLGERA